MSELLCGFFDGSQGGHVHLHKGHANLGMLLLDLSNKGISRTLVAACEVYMRGISKGECLNAGLADSRSALKVGITSQSVFFTISWNRKNWYVTEILTSCDEYDLALERGDVLGRKVDKAVKLTHGS